MDDEVLRFPTKTKPDRLRQWSDNDRELAFEVWLLAAGRDLRTLERLLAEEPYERPIPYGTLWYWQREHGWDIEGDRRLREIAPNVRQRTAGNLVTAALGMSSYLVRVSSGAEDASKEMNAAAKIALDAAGFAAAKSVVTEIPNDKAIESGDAPRTPEEALARLEAYKQTMRRKPG